MQMMSSRSASVDDEHRLIERYTACLWRYSNPATEPYGRGAPGHWSTKRAGAQSPLLGTGVWDSGSDFVDGMSTVSELSLPAAASRTAAGHHLGLRRRADSIDSHASDATAVSNGYHQLSLGRADMMHHDVIEQLEATNRQIMAEIAQLKLSEALEMGSQVLAIGAWKGEGYEHELGDEEGANGVPDPLLVAELHGLKTHVSELERKMQMLKDERQELMEQLSTAMSRLKERSRQLSGAASNGTASNGNRDARPGIRSPPSRTHSLQASPAHGGGGSPLLPGVGKVGSLGRTASLGGAGAPRKAVSAGTSPSKMATNGESPAGKMEEPTRSLFTAAEGISQAMGFLVKELQ